MLATMSRKDFEKYIQGSRKNFEEELVRTGDFSQEKAHERMEAQMNAILPQGYDTQGNCFFDIIAPESGDKVGILWISKMNMDGNESAFIFDIAVNAEHRRKGYASKALIEAEEIARDVDVQEIWLHVFAKNKGAIALYKKMGYVIKRDTHSKDGKVILGHHMMKNL